MSIAPLDKSIPVPLYHQLKCALMEAIESGEWKLGDQLPNEGRLAENFGVSKITVRQALQELADLGYVRREQGRGTFVSKPKVDQGPRELTSFNDEMRRHHLAPSSRVLDCHIGRARDRLAEVLELRPDEPVFVLKRLRMADGEPMGIQTANIPVTLAPGLADEDLENVSLYELLQTKYGLQPARARETYLAQPAADEAAELLGIAPRSPVFSVERVTLLSNGKPFEFVQSVMRGDRYSVVLELAANRTPQATREGGTQ
jgi:GntR family transcriptional regulator